MSHSEIVSLKDTTPDFTTLPNVPVMSVEQFARLVGFTPAVIRGWQDRNYIPSLFIGRHRLVNVAAFTRQCMEVSE